MGCTAGLFVRYMSKLKMITMKLIAVFLFFSICAFAQQKRSLGVQLSPNVSWLSRIEGGSSQIRMYPQVGGEVGMQYQFSLKKQFRIEPGFSFLITRHKVISKPKELNARYISNGLDNRIHLNLITQYVTSLRDSIGLIFTFGTASEFIGIDARFEFGDDLYSVKTVSYDKWNQFVIAGAGLEKPFVRGRLQYSILMNWGLINTFYKTVEIESVSNSFVSSSSNVSLSLKYYFRR